MEKILSEIQKGKYRNNPAERRKVSNLTDILGDPPKRNREGQKKAWYKIGKVLIRKHKVTLHSESKVGARRTYRYYSVNKGDWSEPTCRQFSKMSQYKFNIELSLRSGEFFQGNSPFNEENLEGNGLMETFSTGLGIEEATVDIIMPTADIIMPTADI